MIITLFSFFILTFNLGNGKNWDDDNFSFKFSYPISLKYKLNSEIAFLDPETVPLIPSLDKSIVPLILEKIHFFLPQKSTIDINYELN